MREHSNVWSKVSCREQSADPTRMQVPRVTVILNASSGHHDAQRAAEEIQAGFDEVGCPCRLLIANGAGEVEAHARRAIEEARAQMRDAPPDAHRPVIAAAGGDGTINLLARLVLDAGLTFGLVPLGTFNYLARHLGIPLEPRAAAIALATGVTRRVHVGRVNGNLFLNNASFGLYRALLEEREQFKQRFGRYKIVAAFAGLYTLLRFRKVYTLRLDVDGKPVAVRSPMLFFGLNSLQFENLGMDAAACTQAGMMAVIALQPSGRWQLLRLALRGALHRLHDSTDLRTLCASQAQVLLPGRRRLRVAVDGESLECRLPLQFEVVRDALEVVVPREPEERK